MSVFGNHGGFIFAAYVVFVAVLVGLVAWIMIDGRALKRRLADLEARGIRRRSARSGTTNE
jgi:heme exporter protein D